MKNKILIILLLIASGLGFGVYYAEAPESIKGMFGDTQGSLDVFKQVGNSIIPRTATRDFGIGSTATSSSDFAVDPGNNTIIINGILYTFPTDDGDANEVLQTNGSGVLTWDTDDSGGGGGGSFEVKDFTTHVRNIASISFNPLSFNVVASTSTDAAIYLDWTNPTGVPSRSAENTWSALNVFSAGASGSNTEWTGTASASFFNGNAFGGIDCNDDGDQFAWSGGIFTCGTLADADIPNNITIDLATSASDLTCTDCINATEIENIYLLLTGGTLTGNLIGTSASLSANFEATGYASASKYFTLDLGAGALTQNQFGIDNGGFGQFVYRASGSEHTLTDEKTMFMSIGSTSFNTWASRSIGYMFRGRTIKRIQCKAASATSVQINLSSAGTTDMDTITCATTNTFDDGTIANATLTKGVDLVLERRTISGEVDFVEISVTYVDTRE